MLKHAKTVFSCVAAAALAAALFPVAPAAPERTVVVADDAAAYADEQLTLEERAKQASTQALAKVDSSAAEAVDAYFEAREQEVEGQGGSAADAGVQLADEVSETSEQRAEGLKQMAEQANFDVIDASTSVQVESVERAGDTLEVSASEYTIIEYDDLADGPGGSTDIAIIGTPHEMTLESTAGGYKIAQDAYDEADISGVVTTDSPDNAVTSAASGVADAIDEFAQTLELEEAEAASIKYVKGYNPALAIAYSNKYAMKYNPKYHNFNPDGGDCANFTSQCINAGGFEQFEGSYGSSSSWYYDSVRDYSQSWVYCPTFVEFFKKHGKYVDITETSDASAEAVYPGSPVVYMQSRVWSHAVFCVGYNSAGTPVINAHNRDRYHVPYSYFSPHRRCTIQLTKDRPTLSTFKTQTASGAAAADPNTAEQFTWVALDDTSAALYSYTGSAGTLKLKSKVKDEKGKSYSVASIWDDAFEGCEATSITLPSSVEAVRPGAFEGCDALQQVKLGSHVATIGEDAFSGCTSLATVSGAKRVKTIETGAFEGCSALTSIDSLAKLKTVGEAAFRGCASLQVLPDMPKAKKLGTEAFSGCSGLLALPALDAVKTIGKRTFAGCTSLKKAMVASPNLTSIGSGAFASCAALTKVSVSSKMLQKIKSKVFQGCKALSKLTLKTKKLYGSAAVGTKAFSGVPAAMTANVPNAKAKAYKSLFVKAGLPKKAKVQ